MICLHPGDLAHAVQSSYQIGEVIDVEVVKPGKDEGQAVGYLADGSMVVVNDALASVGLTISAEIISVLPSGAGRIVLPGYLVNPEASASRLVRRLRGKTRAPDPELLPRAIPPPTDSPAPGHRAAETPPLPATDWPRSGT